MIYRIRLIFLFCFIWFCHNINAIILPHVIHFIWMGAEISPDYLINIESIAKANPDYQVMIWTDNKPLFSSLEQGLSFTGGLLLKDLDEPLISMPAQLKEYFFHEIQAEGFAEEKNSLEPNYAAASDILRMQVLKLYGGIYLDTDVSIKQQADAERPRGTFGDVSAPLGFILPFILLKITQTRRDTLIALITTSLEQAKGIAFLIS